MTAAFKDGGQAIPASLERKRGNISPQAYLRHWHSAFGGDVSDDPCGTGERRGLLWVVWNGHTEAVTSPPALVYGVAKRTTHGNRSRVTITSCHGEAEVIANLLDMENCF